MGARGTWIPLLLALSLSGCAAPKRFVTATHWWNDRTFFLAYSEESTNGMQAKLMKCDLQPDNTVRCVPQEAVNRLINPPR